MIQSKPLTRQCPRCGVTAERLAYHSRYTIRGRQTVYMIAGTYSTRARGEAVRKSHRSRLIRERVACKLSSSAQGGACLERLNGTIRQHVAPPHRKTCGFAKCRTALDTQTQLFKSYYNA